MPKLILTRIDQSASGTFGSLCDEANNQVAVTCERPDNGNQKMGCIPTGAYQVIVFNSPSKGRDFLVQNVPARSMIEIHKGNTIKDTEGCILVGATFGSVNGMKGILNSSITLQNMLRSFPQGFSLEITEQL